MLIQLSRGKPAKYKVPRQVEFRTELPKTNVGKILRRALQYGEPWTRSPSAPENNHNIRAAMVARGPANAAPIVFLGLVIRPASLSNSAIIQRSPFAF